MIFWLLISATIYVVSALIARSSFDPWKPYFGERQDAVFYIAEVIALVSFIACVAIILVFAWRYLP